MKSTAWAITAAVWIANAGVAGFAVHELQRQGQENAPEVAQSPRLPPEGAARTADASEARESTAIEMPMDTIVGFRRGSAELQPAPFVEIGPGAVTHPPARSPRPSR